MYQDSEISRDVEGGGFYIENFSCHDGCHGSGTPNVSFEDHGPVAIEMTVVVEDNISQDGICYYLLRARMMSDDEAMDVLNNEILSDDVLRECWRVSLEIYHERVAENHLYDWQQIDRHHHSSTVAVICYLLEIPNVSRRMNHFCRQALPDPASWEAFPYKGLWFFLLMAFDILPSLEVNDVFRGVSIFTRMPDYQVPVVQFISASLSAHEAERYAGPDGLLLTIRGVPQDYIKDVSFYTIDPDKREVLIFPFVIFSAGDVHRGHLYLEFVGGTPDEYVSRSTNGFPEGSALGQQP